MGFTDADRELVYRAFAMDKQAAAPAVTAKKTAPASAAAVTPKVDIAALKNELKNVNPLATPTVPSAKEKTPVMLPGFTAQSANSGTGDIPLIAPTGKAVLNALSRLLGAVGWQGGSQATKEWAQSPTGRNVAGSATALAAAIAAAMLANKLSKRAEVISVEAGSKLDLVKAAVLDA